MLGTFGLSSYVVVNEVKYKAVPFLRTKVKNVVEWKMNFPTNNVNFAATQLALQLEFTIWDFKSVINRVLKQQSVRKEAGTKLKLIRIFQEIRIRESFYSLQT